MERKTLQVAVFGGCALFGGLIVDCLDTLERCDHLLAPILAIMYRFGIE